MRLIDADKLLETMKTFLTKAEDEARYAGRRGAGVTWNDAVYMIKVAPAIEPEIMADGTLHVTVNADVANIDRILLSQAGTHSGDLYYRNDELKPEPQWIPWNSGKFPGESGTYAVTAYDGATKRVTYAKYQKRLKRWELTGARAYWRILAWMPLPEPYQEEGDSE